MFLTGETVGLAEWIIVFFVFFILRYMTSERKKEKKAARGAKITSHNEFFFVDRQKRNELRNVMIVTTLMVFYLIGMGPYIGKSKVDQIKRVRVIRTLKKYSFFKITRRILRAKHSLIRNKSYKISENMCYQLL